MRIVRPERRQLARLPLEVCLQIAGTKTVDTARTRNISACGIYFVTRCLLEVGEEVECVLMLPERLTLAPSPVLIGCRARVLRVNKDLPNRTRGVAVQVHSYDFSWQGTLPVGSLKPA